MFDVRDFEDQVELYFEGYDLDNDSDYGISVYDESQLDWALEESRWNNPVKEVF